MAAGTSKTSKKDVHFRLKIERKSREKNSKIEGKSRENAYMFIIIILLNSLYCLLVATTYFYLEVINVHFFLIKLITLTLVDTIGFIHIHIDIRIIGSGIFDRWLNCTL